MGASCSKVSMPKIPRLMRKNRVFPATDNSSAEIFLVTTCSPLPNDDKTDADLPVTASATQKWGERPVSRMGNRPLPVIRVDVCPCSKNSVLPHQNEGFLCLPAASRTGRGLCTTLNESINATACPRPRAARGLRTPHYISRGLAPSGGVLKARSVVRIPAVPAKVTSTRTALAKKPVLPLPSSFFPGEVVNSWTKHVKIH